MESTICKIFKHIIRDEFIKSNQQHNLWLKKFMIGGTGVTEIKINDKDGLLSYLF